MVSTVMIAVYVTSLALAALGVGASLRGRPPGRALLAGSVAVEAVLVVQAVVAVILLVRGHHPPETLTFVAYLIGVLLALPVAVVWSLAEQTRWSSLVVAVGALTVAVMTVRMETLWRGAGV